MKLVCLVCCLPSLLYIFYLFRLCYGTKLELLTLLPYHHSREDTLYNPSWAAGDDVYPVMQLARDQINAHTTVLQNYTLELIQGTSGCQNWAQTISGFVQGLYQNESRNVVGIVGPGCSSSTIELAPLSNRKELRLIMLHGSGTSLLSDRSRYKYQLGTLGSNDNIVSAIKFLLKKWRKVVVFYDELRDFYSQIADKLVNDNNTTEIQTISWPSEMHPFQVVKKRGFRVVIVLCPLELTRHIMCYSWKNNMIFENYQFVYTGHDEVHLLAEAKTFTEDNMVTSCSKEEMQMALKGNFLVVYSFFTRKDTLSVLNTSVSEYKSAYAMYRNNYNNNTQYIGKKSNYSPWATYLYDSIWTWALVLDNLTKTRLDLFEGRHFNTNEVADIFLEQFYKINFDGISGDISFNRATGFTSRDVDIIQNDGKSSNKVAKVNSTSVMTLSSYIQIESVHYARENVTMSILFLIAVFGLLSVTVLLQILTWKYRKDAAIKAATPLLLHMSYFGIYFLLLGLTIYLLYSAIPLPIESKGCVCSILWIWMFPIGFTLSFGPIAMRTWRLYRIFIHFTNPGPFIDNKVLLLSIFSLLVTDILFAILWTATDPFQYEEKVYISSGSPHFQVYCTSKLWWFVMTLMSKALLLFFVMVLAFLTRKIKHSFFITRLLQLLNYFVCITLVLGLSLHFILLDEAFNINWSFAGLCVTIFSFTVIILALTFLPPLFPTVRRIFSLKR